MREVKKREIGTMRHRWMQEDISHQHRAQSPKYQLDIGPIAMVHLTPMDRISHSFGNFLGSTTWGRHLGLAHFRVGSP